MYNRIHCLIVNFFPLHGSYHGLHTESEVTAGATGDTWWLFCTLRGVRAAPGIRNAKCPCGDVTTWKPPYSFMASGDSEPPLRGAVICVLLVCPRSPRWGPYRLIWVTQAARWPRRRVLTSAVTPSHVDRKRVTSPTHSLNPARYFPRMDGSMFKAAREEERILGNGKKGKQPKTYQTHKTQNQAERRLLWRLLYIRHWFSFIFIKLLVNLMFNDAGLVSSYSSCEVSNIKADMLLCDVCEWI